MESNNYIKDLENQYFELETLIKNKQATVAQHQRYNEITDELKELPDNVLSQRKRNTEVEEKKTVKRKIKL